MATCKVQPQPKKKKQQEEEGETNMSGIRAGVVAAQQLRAGHTVDQVVEGTGLEPREVMQIAQKLKLKATPGATDGGDVLESIMTTLSRQSQAARYPRKAQRQLAKAADYVTAAMITIEEDAGKAEKRAEVARLEQELRRARAELRGDNPTGPKVDSRAIRSWAYQNHIEINDHGRIPQRVIDAYNQAVAS